MEKSEATKEAIRGQGDGSLVPSTYTWRHGRQLASISDGTTTWTYTYDANGMRTQRSNGTDTYRYIYNGSHLTCMTKGSDTLYFSYDADGYPFTLIHNGTTYYYIVSPYGTVDGILDSTGTLVAYYGYDAWGGLIGCKGPMADTLGVLNPLRYRSYVYDNETGLYYVSSRYYDPEIGRWINVDSVIAGIGGSVQGYNMFSYCFNNPVNMTDETGSWPCRIDVESGIEKAIVRTNNNTVIPSIVGFVQNIIEDLNNYSSYNQSEDVVFSSNYFSNYKGALVVKTPLDASLSFGFIGLSSSQQNTNTLNHEYGHTVQMKNMGVSSYIMNVAIPSVTINLLDRVGKLKYDYYGAPWEAEADMLGGVTRKYNNTPWPEGSYSSYFDLIKMFFK